VSEHRQKRRRLREQRRVREAMLLDLGALVYELHRQGRRAPELLQQKAAELTVVDEEVRELEAELDGRAAPVGEPGPSDETAEVDALPDDEELDGEPDEGEPPEEEPDEDDPLDEETDEDDPFEDEPAAAEPDDDEPEEEGELDDALAEHEEPRA
jgi:hypothetical protein